MGQLIMADLALLLLFIAATGLGQSTAHEPEALAPPANVAPKIIAPASKNSKPTKPDNSDQTVLLKIVVTAVEGMVDVRTSDQKLWKPAKPGQQFEVGAEFRTGPRSSVEFKIPPDQTVVLDRLGTIRILDAIQQQGKVKTELGMRHGRVTYEIEAAGLEHDSNIRSPSAVIAVRGTELTYQDDAFGAFCMGQGRDLQYIDRFGFKRQPIQFGGGAVKAKMQSGRSSAAEVNRSEASLDPRGRFAGRSVLERQRQAENPGTGGNDYRTVASIQQATIAAGGALTGVPRIPGPLIFTLVWQNEALGSANLDLSAVLPNKRTISISNPVVGISPEQGTHSGDMLGQNGGGVERIRFPLHFPRGQYRLKAQHNGPSSEVSAQIFLVGVRGPLAETILDEGRSPSNPISLEPGQSFRTTVSPYGQTYTQTYTQTVTQ